MFQSFFSYLLLLLNLYSAYLVVWRSDKLFGLLVIIAFVNAYY